MTTFSKADLSSSRDSEELIALLESYATDITGGGQGLPEFTKENLVAELQKVPGFHAIIARINNEPAGLAICFEAFSTFACRKILNIHDFLVSPQFRGQGVGKDLLGQVEELARSLDCCKITLEVLEGNKVARNLYEKMGFAGYELDPEMGHALFLDKKLS